MAKAKYPKVITPGTGTKAAKEFYREWNDINAFLDWVVLMATRIDYTANVARETLKKIGVENEGEKQNSESDKVHISMVERLSDNRQILLEMVLIKHVDSYLNYLASLLYEIFILRPETLKSSEQVRLEHVLEYDSIDGLIMGLAERKVESLSYQSLGDLTDYFKNKFGLNVVDEVNRSSLLEFIETRNIAVHNRCVKNKRYVMRTGANQNEIGEKKKIGISYVEDMALLLFNLVTDLDKSARNHLKLKGVRFRFSNKNNKWKTYVLFRL